MGKLVGYNGKFGRLTFLHKVSHPRKAAFRCECGTEREYFVSNVRTGKTLSCGCLNRELTIARSTRHGNARRGAHSRAYDSWANMISRCTNSHRADFVRYGERGILVCKRWSSFENFFEDMGNPPAGMSLDRKDNDGNYELGNCRWATPTQQANNRRSNVLIEFRGKKQNIEGWAAELQIDDRIIRDRVRRGESDPVKIFRAPEVARILKFQGKSRTIASWSKETGLSAACIYKRLSKGLPTDQVLMR